MDNDYQVRSAISRDRNGDPKSHAGRVARNTLFVAGMLFIALPAYLIGNAWRRFQRWWRRQRGLSD